MVNRDHHEDRATNAIADRMDPTDRGGPTARRFLRGMVTGAEICRRKANANAISMIQMVRDETTRTVAARGVRFPAGMRPIAIAHLRHRKNRLHILAWSPRPPLLPWRRSSD